MGIIRGKLWSRDGRGPLNNKSYIGELIRHAHGQPLIVQTLNQFLVTGGGTIKYWDAVKHEAVDTKEELTLLMEHQKSYIKEYAGSE